MSADESVATSHSLKLDLALGRRVGRRAIGIEIGRSVIALDDSDATTRSEQFSENPQNLSGPREVLQDKTDENMIEGLGFEGQSEDVRLPKLDVSETGKSGPSPGFGD